MASSPVLIPSPWEFDELLSPSNFQPPPPREVPFQWYSDWRLDDLRHIGIPHSFRIEGEAQVFHVDREPVGSLPWSIEYFLYALDYPKPCAWTPRGERELMRPAYHVDYIKRFVRERLDAGLTPTDAEGWRTALTALESTALVDLAPGSSAPERLAFEAEVAASNAEWERRALANLERVSTKAPLFARIPREDMARSMACGVYPEAWRRITALVDADTLKYVEMRAADIQVTGPSC